jgi:hypothetical protein
LFQEPQDNRFLWLGESFRRQLSGHHFRHTEAMSFKSFDFFDQRIAASGSIAGRCATRPCRFTRKLGKLRKTIITVNCLTTKTSANQEKRNNCGVCLA